MAFFTSPSEITLVAQPTGSVLTYTLTNDNPSNTTLVDLSSGHLRPAYTVQTNITGSKTVTTVKNDADAVIATLEWRESLPDKVTIGDKPTVSLTTWMKFGLLPLSPVSFRDNDGRKYQWKNVAAGLNMELYATDTPGGPIAAFYKARTHYADNSHTPSTFLMTNRGQEIADLCVVSFLFLEKRRRMRENSSKNRIEAVGLPFK